MQRKLNKYNFKLFYTSLFNNHTVKGIGLITMINLQGTSILEINTPKPKNIYIQRNKSNQNNNIIPKHYSSIKEENQKPKETKSQRITQSMGWKDEK